MGAIDKFTFEAGQHTHRSLDWEAAWAAYDDSTYNAALDYLQPDDVVLDIGAGDLRFARRAAARVRSVIAIERRPELLLPASAPDNLTVICGNALEVPFPRQVTVGVLLMRHCAKAHFAQCVARLRSIGCERLITNARWGMSVEQVSLCPQPPYSEIAPGWYACMCGAAGFKYGDPDRVTPSTLAHIADVETCPACLEPRA